MKFDVILSKATASHLVKRLIWDLTGAGMSYSQIARRIGVSPSTIQKLSAMEGRVPRYQALMDLLCFYQKIFSSPSNYHAKVNCYYQAHYQVIEETLFNLEPILISYATQKEKALVH